MARPLQIRGTFASGTPRKISQLLNELKIADSEDDEDACAMEFKGFVMDALTAVVGDDAAPHVDNVYAEAVRESLEMRMRLGMDVPRLSANTRMAEHEVRNGRARVEDDAKGEAEEEDESASSSSSIA